MHRIASQIAREGAHSDACGSVLGLFVLALFVGMYWFATVADRVEDESRGMVDEETREPYGSKWLSILGGTDRRR